MPIPIAVAFCRTALSVRFNTFATFETGVLAFECALSSRKSSFVQGLRCAAFFLGGMIVSVGSLPTASGSQAEPVALRAGPSPTPPYRCLNYCAVSG